MCLPILPEENMKLNLIRLLIVTAPLAAAAEANKPFDAAGPSDALSLDQVVNEVLRNNPSLKAARANWEAMKERIPQARAWDDPRVGFDTTAGRFVNVPDNSFTDQKLIQNKAIITESGVTRSRIRDAGSWVAAMATMSTAMTSSPSITRVRLAAR